uniref:Uncharacterized protein n=1 Tax=Cannabis sativa TaxID=3483 RepID=A0A803R2G5_CANSA
MVKLFLMLGVDGDHFLCTLLKSIRIVRSLGFVTLLLRKIILTSVVESLGLRMWRSLWLILAHLKWKDLFIEYIPLECLRCVT